MTRRGRGHHGGAWTEPRLGYPSILALAAACACGGVEQPSSLGDAPPTATPAPTPPKPTPQPTSPIAGTIIDGDGIPRQGVSVIQGPRVAMTDAMGAFTIPDVPPTYDLVVVEPSMFPAQVPRSIMSIQGMATRAPMVALWGQRMPSKSAMLHLALTPSAGVGFSLGSIATGTGVVPVTIEYADWNARGVSWRGASTATAKLTVLRYDTSPSGAALRFTGFSTVTVDVVVGDDKTIQVEPLGAATFATRTVAATVDVPNGYSAELRGFVKLSSVDYDYLDIPGEPITASTGSVLLPDLPSVSFALNAQSSDGRALCHNMTAWGDLGSLAAAHIALEGAPALVSPSDGATGVTTATPFAWSGTGSDPVGVILDPEGAGPMYIFISATGVAQLPDASLAGAALPRGLRYEWFEWHWHGVADTQSLAAGGFFSTTTGPWSVSAARQFTTAQ